MDVNSVKEQHLNPRGQLLQHLVHHEDFNQSKKKKKKKFSLHKNQKPKQEKL
jgi:23S rRNA U2552 (ribose-2'-O)-methylase RlmE/FtsJ